MCGIHRNVTKNNENHLNSSRSGWPIIAISKRFISWLEFSANFHDHSYSISLVSCIFNAQLNSITHQSPIILLYSIICGKSEAFRTRAIFKASQPIESARTQYNLFVWLHWICHIEEHIYSFNCTYHHRIVKSIIDELAGHRFAWPWAQQDQFRQINTAPSPKPHANARESYWTNTNM